MEISSIRTSRGTRSSGGHCHFIRSPLLLPPGRSCTIKRNRGGKRCHGGHVGSNRKGSDIRPRTWTGERTLQGTFGALDLVLCVGSITKLNSSERRSISFFRCSRKISVNLKYEDANNNDPQSLFSNWFTAPSDSWLYYFPIKYHEKNYLCFINWFIWLLPFSKLVYIHE